MTLRPYRCFAPLLLVLFSTGAAAQTGGVSREEMWPAPTAEDWKRPCLITWQRTFEDAVAVSLETGKPILVCVNMDGEIASEHYAGIRYRQSEIAALYEPYVCVIASVYRHTPRDHDEEGRRILCPRFGSVTCGEHIAIEPGLFEGYFDGQRVAPRHIMLELDKREVYDVYYAFDTDSVFRSIREGIENRPPPPPDERGDRTLLERVASHDVADRQAVEEAFRKGDRELRRRLIEQVVLHAEVPHVELLRQAIFGLDLELSEMAREALARSTSTDAVGLLADVLQSPLAAQERQALIAALERLGASSPKARTLAAVHQGLASSSAALEIEGWSDSEGVQSRAEYRAAASARLEERAEASQRRPADPESHLALAESFLAAADKPGTEPKFAQLLHRDARAAAREAERLGAAGWRLDAALALAAQGLGDEEQARARAEAAVRALPPEVGGPQALGVLEIFAEARRKAIADAVLAKEDWPAEWLADLHAAYSALAQHPSATDEQVTLHHDFLKWLGATGPAARVLDEGLARFPESWTLHDRLRARLLAERGAQGLEEAYGAIARERAPSSNLPWFEGYTSIVAAEFHRRQGDDEAALAAYGRAIEHYRRAIESNPDSRGSSQHYIAVAMAGRARVALERGRLEEALDEIVGSFELVPDAAATRDGLNLSAVDTANMLLARLKARERTELAQRLQAALDELDPDLRRLPEFERQGPRRRRAGG